jgi:hypothetical protein
MKSPDQGEFHFQPSRIKRVCLDEGKKHNPLPIWVGGGLCFACSEGLFQLENLNFPKLCWMAFGL